MRYLMAEDIGGEFRGVPRRLEREVHLARPPRVLELLHRLGAAEREPTRVRASDEAVGTRRGRACSQPQA